MAEIDGERVILTGASSGIGKALAFELARKGAQIILTSRRLDLLNRVADEITHALPGVTTPLAMACDVTNMEQVRRVIHVCKENLGGLDILIHCAAYVGATQAPGWGVPSANVGKVAAVWAVMV